MATTRNPFNLLENVARWFGYTLLLAFMAFSVIVAGVAVSSHYDWDWWGLLLIPGVPIGLIILAVLAGLLREGFERISDAWRTAKWKWDDKHRQE